MVAKRPPLRLGRLLRQGGETHGSVRANVSASTGGLTAWAAVVNAQIRPGVGDRRTPSPHSHTGRSTLDPPTPPLDKGRLGAGGGYMLLRSGPQ